MTETSKAGQLEATGTTDGEVEGIDDLRAQYEQTYGQDPGATYYSPSGYVPSIPLAYWTFRLMIGFGLLAAALAAEYADGAHDASDRASAATRMRRLLAAMETGRPATGGRS